MDSSDCDIKKSYICDVEYSEEYANATGVDICPDCSDDSANAATQERPAVSTFEISHRIEQMAALVLTTTTVRPATGGSHETTDGNPSLVYPDGTYEGRINDDGVPHGKGKMVFQDGSIYEGDWANGQMDGNGVCKYSDGRGEYHGNWKGGHPHGKGTCLFSDGIEYTGSWKQGYMNGQGHCKFGNSEEYKGEWKNNQPEGKGVFTYASGNSYDGQWKKGKREGNGTFKFSNGDEYSGSFLDDKKDGIGVYRWSNGDWDIKTYCEDIVDEGVRWNAAHDKAWKIEDGEVIREISLQEAGEFRDNACMVSPFLAFYLLND